MARLNSQPASRDAEALQPSTAPARATRLTRSTRSQSREPSVPLDDVNKVAAAPKRGRKAKGNELKTVPEAAVDDAELRAQALAAQQEAAADESEEGDQELEAARRGSVHSSVSGTTAKTSFSQEEISDLDADVMIDILPELYKAAENLCSLLVPADPQARLVVRKEVRVLGSRHSKLFKNRLETLNTHKDKFGSQLYIHPSIVLRTLLGVKSMSDVPEGPWRPDSLVYRINMTQMLRTLLITLLDVVELDNAGFEEFSQLEQDFASTIAGPIYDPEAVRLCLAMQVQLTIARLHIFSQSPGYEPLEVIAASFFEDDANGDKVYKHVDTLHMQHIDDGEMQAWMEIIQRLVDGLEEPFGTEANLFDALAQLRRSYPHEQLLNQLYGYYEHRTNQLAEQIATVGGVEGIMSSLADEVQRRENSKLADERRRNFVKTDNTARKSFGKGAIAKLKTIEQRLSGTAPTPAVEPLPAIAPPATAPPAVQAPAAQMMHLRLAQAQQPALHVDGYVPPPADDDEVGEPTTQARAASATELLGFQNQKTQNARSGTGRAFIDRQEGAQRVSLDDSQPSQQHMRVSGQPYYVASLGRRSHAEIEDFDPTQDEGFQTDTRSHAAADARRRAAPAPRLRSTHSVIAVPSGSNTVDYELPTSATATPSKRHRKNPGSTVPAFEPVHEDDIVNATGVRPGDYQAAKLFAKQGRIQASQKRLPQVRTPWSPEEENALISLIENHGGDGLSYAGLKKLDGDDILHRRSAEDIRFKARNMKQTFILSKTPLPENWEYVALDKKAIEKIRSRGIQYYQEPIRAVNFEAHGA